MKTKQVLGLDLGSCAFKLVALELKDSKRPLLMHAKVLEIPSGADQEARQVFLKQLLEGIPLTKFQQIVSVVDDPYTCVHQVLTPPMPAGELPGAVRWEMQRYLAVPPDEMAIAYQVVGEVENDGVKKLKILAVAVLRTAIQQHLALFSQTGLTPTQLLPKSVALAAWYNRVRQAGEAPTAILLLGGTGSEFLVVQGRQILFTRKIPVAGYDITKGMTGVLMTAQGPMGLNELEAEKIKRSMGIPTPGSSEATVSGVSGMQLLSLIRGSLDRLAVELERSLAFYGESTGGIGVAQLILVGGGAHLKGLDAWLQARLGIRVTLPFWMEEIQQASDALNGPAAVVPLSLVPAVGAAVSAGAGINLLPVEIKEAVREKVKRAALIGILATVVLGALFLRIGMGTYQAMLRKQIAAFQLEESATAQELERAKAAVAARERLEQEPHWDEVFKELSRSVTREIYLTEMQINGREVVMRGRVRELGRTTDVILAEFIRTLGDGLFTNVKMVSCRQLEQPAQSADFEIGCLLK